MPICKSKACQTQDSDFADRTALYGPPPKMIRLRWWQPFQTAIEKLLRHHAQAIATFEQDATSTCLEML